MLKKQKGIFQVNKLQAMLLMEADFNFINGLMYAKHMMEWTEYNHWIPCELYGSHRNHEATEITMNHHLIADIS